MKIQYLSQYVGSPICIADKATPIIVPFGPRCSGKSLLLIRLFRYLRSCGNVITVDNIFIRDQRYKMKCDDYIYGLSSRFPEQLNKIRLPLLGYIISCRGRKMYQFIDMPGDMFFNRDEIDDQSTMYISEIISCPNPKIWLFLAEPNLPLRTRTEFVNRISKICDLSCKKDRFIIVANKVDRLPHLFGNNGVPDVGIVCQEIKHEFEGLFDLFKETHPIKKLWKPYSFYFTPFYSFDFIENQHPLRIHSSSDYYPEFLWKEIIKCTKVKI